MASHAGGFFSYIKVIACQPLSRISFEKDNQKVMFPFSKNKSVFMDYALHLEEYADNRQQV